MLVFPGIHVKKILFRPLLQTSSQGAITVSLYIVVIKIIIHSKYSFVRTRQIIRCRVKAALRRQQISNTRPQIGGTKPIFII